jgi:hypothetical protein
MGFCLQLSYLPQNLADVGEHDRAALVTYFRHYNDIKANVWYAERRYSELMSFVESQRCNVDRLRGKLLDAKHCVDELIRITLYGDASVTDSDDHQASERLSEELRLSNRPFYEK